jgi:hypothetical protein
MKLPATLLLSFFLTPSLFSQDLDRLRSRVEEHWKYRVGADKAKAGQYVDSGSRSKYANLFDAVPLKNATIVAFEFSKDSKDVFVRVRTMMDTPIGQLSKDVTERWSWTGGNWFLRVDALESETLMDRAVSSNLAHSPVQVIAGVPRPDFEVQSSQVDLGSHTQGEKITGSISFKGKKSEIIAIGTDRMPIVTVKETRWLDENGGTLDFVVDTSLMSRDLSRSVKFFAVGAGHVRTYSSDVKLLAKIQGKIEFTQHPEQIDVRGAGMVEIEMKNLLDRPVAISSADPWTPGFIVKENTEPRPPVILEIKAGDSRRLTVRYPDQLDPFDELGVQLTFNDDLFPEPVPFRFNVVQPKVEAPPLVDPAVLERILRESRAKQR